MAVQEGIFRAPWAAFSFRLGPGQWTYARIHADRLVPEEISSTEFLRFKEGLVTHADAVDPLELDFGPFSRGFPRLTEPRSIGQGLSFLNRHLASQLFRDGGAGRRRGRSPGRPPGCASSEARSSPRGRAGPRREGAP